MNCIKNHAKTPDEVPLGQYRIARYLCEDTMRGTGCPHHEQIAERIYLIVVRSQEAEREKNAIAALDRIEKAFILKTITDAQKIR